MERIASITFRNCNYFLDFAVCLCSYIVGLLFWNFAYSGNLQPTIVFDIDRKNLLLPFLVYYLVVFFFLALIKFYNSSRLRTLAACFLQYCRVVAFAVLVLTCFSLFFPIIAISRSLLVGTATTSVLLFLAKEILVRSVLLKLRKNGFYVRKAIIVGSDFLIISTLARECKENLLLGIELIGLVLPTEAKPLKDTNMKVLGDLRSFSQILKDACPDIVIFLSQELKNQTLTEALWVCEERGIEVWLKLNLLDRIIYKASISSIKEIPFISFQSIANNPTALLIKYFADKVISSILIILLLPIMICVAIAVRLTSPGPILFKQTRAGLNGRKFELLKFRSMIADAEAKKSELFSKNEMEGPVFKIEEDPRITRLGRFLRRSSLDELPQLWNVLKGEMSLVGPRPMDYKEVDQIEGWQRRRLTMKPGITCIWQTSGRNRIKSFEDWSKLDLEYIDNWSLWLDFVLLIKTIPVVLLRKGAS
jgi:exopolysaccharide biosynthesis polyprenyl glycosylphosphotransferase